MKLLFGIALAAAFGLVAQAAPAQSISSIAHPAFWVVYGKQGGTAYLLSSVHVLPPDTDWHDAAIDQAIKNSGTFIFEVPSGSADEAEATRFILERGRLPNGQTLQSLLSPAAQKDYAAACALAGMQTASLNDKRPWLAAVVLTVSYMNQRHLSSAMAPDMALVAYAMRYGKSIRYFDTTREQLEFLARYDDVTGLGGFSAMLGDFTSQPEREDALIGAWRDGDTNALAQHIAANFSGDPEGLKLIAAHNRVWADRLEDYLREGRTYFVTVGVAHLVGPSGLPALLRSDGYQVDGP